MKTITVFLLAAFWITTLNAQNNNLPATKIKTLDGTTVVASEITQPGTTTILVFWKSSENKCIENLENLQEIWLESLQSSGVKMISVCVDCNGSWSKIKPIVNGNNWEFDTYVDTNGDLKRAMNVNTFPCTIVIDDLQNQICRYNNYFPGYEELLCEKVLNQSIAVKGE